MRKLLGDTLFDEMARLCETVCEIRIRKDRPVLFKTEKGEYFSKYVTTGKEMREMIRRATDGALYAYENQVSEGYIEYEKGIRIGIVGESRLNDKKTALREPYALCIRLPQQKIGIATRFFHTPFENTLIVSPPSGGKTTLLRDYARLLSDKYDVLIVDERYEICGMGLTMEMGKRADVTQGIPKSAVYETAIRTMSPQIVVCDELFGDEDYFAVEKMINAGIKVLATHHGEEDAPKRYRALFPERIVLSPYPKYGTVVKHVAGES